MEGKLILCFLRRGFGEAEEVKVMDVGRVGRERRDGGGLTGMTVFQDGRSAHCCLLDDTGFRVNSHSSIGAPAV